MFAYLNFQFFIFNSSFSKRPILRVPQQVVVAVGLEAGEIFGRDEDALAPIHEDHRHLLVQNFLGLPIQLLALLQVCFGAAAAVTSSISAWKSNFWK